MHEFAIASEIVRNVVETAEKNGGGKIVSVQLEIGTLTVLNVEQMTFWVEELLKGTVGEGTRIEVKRIRGVVGCDACGRKSRLSEETGSFDALGPLSCPRCGSFRVKVERGKECCLKRVQILQ